MNKDTEIQKAINLLREEGFTVIKISKAMERDMDECARMDLEEESKSCFGCSCNICLIQNY